LWEGRDDISVGEAEEIEHAHTFIHKNKSLLTYTHNTTHSLTHTDRQTDRSTFGLQSMMHSRGSPMTFIPPVGVRLYTQDWAIRSKSRSSAAQAPDTPDLG
jgi:hypothetical protein